MSEPVTFTHDYGGLVRLSAITGGLGAPIRRAIGEYLAAQMRRNFVVGGRPEKWKPSIRAMITGGKTLVKTGILRNSITWDSPDAETINIGTAQWYGYVHQFGKDIEAKNKPFLMFRLADGKFIRKRKVHIPRRQFLVWLPEFEDRCGKIIQYIIEQDILG